LLWSYTGRGGLPVTKDEKFSTIQDLKRIWDEDVGNVRWRGEVVVGDHRYSVTAESFSDLCWLSFEAMRSRHPDDIGFFVFPGDPTIKDFGGSDEEVRGGVGGQNPV
jgi:hypothetical protein